MNELKTLLYFYEKEEIKSLNVIKNLYINNICNYRVNCFKSCLIGYLLAAEIENICK